MKSRRQWAPLLAFAAFAGGAAASLAGAAVGALTSIEAEPSLERRSRLALEFAHARVRPVVDAYLGGDAEQARGSAREIASAVELSWASLEATGKHARRNPKHFKRAEIQTRKLAAALKEAQRELHYEEQRELDGLIAGIEEIHSKLLLAIMSRKSK